MKKNIGYLKDDSVNSNEREKIKKKIQIVYIETGEMKILLIREKLPSALILLLQKVDELTPQTSMIL